MACLCPARRCCELRGTLGQGTSSWCARRRLSGGKSYHIICVSVCELCVSSCGHDAESWRQSCMPRFERTSAGISLTPGDSKKSPCHTVPEYEYLAVGSPDPGEFAGAESRACEHAEGLERRGCRCTAETLLGCRRSESHVIVLAAAKNRAQMRVWRYTNCCIGPRASLETMAMSALCHEHGQVGT
jgi:hypothetical protein